RWAPDLNEYHVGAVRGHPCQVQPLGHKDFLIFAVEFVAVAVALGNLELTVGLMSKRTGLKPGGPGAQAHGSPQLIDASQFTKFVDDAMRRGRVKLRTIRAGQAADITR